MYNMNKRFQGFLTAKTALKFLKKLIFVPENQLTVKNGFALYETQKCELVKKTFG